MSESMETEKAMPIASRSREWDSSAAEKRVRSWADADKPNAKYRSAFLWHDKKAPDLFGSYKLQFADIVDGKLTIVPRAVFAIAGVLSGARGGVDLPSGDVAGVRRKVERLYAQIRNKEKDESIQVPWGEKEETEKGLWKNLF